MAAPEFITVENLRLQLNMSPDEGDENQLSLYCSAAEAAVENNINRKIYPEGSEIPVEDLTGIIITDDLILGMLMTAATFWQSREINSVGVQVHEVPQLADMLIHIYRETPL